LKKLIRRLKILHMVNYIKKILVVAIIFSSFASAQKKEIVAYYGGYRSGNSGYLIKDIEIKGLADKLTVINYAFAVPVLDSLGNIFPRVNSFTAYQEIYSSEMSINGIADDSTQPLRGNFNQLRILKERYPHIKILLAIGGWGGSKYFSDLALTHESREKFVNACIDIFIDGNLPIDNNADLPAGQAGGKGSLKGLFDGFDLDWEFPISGGPEGTHYNPNDRENHTALFALFREKLDSISQELLLTAAVSARTWEFWKYNFKKDQEYLDWFNVMTYDYHGSWETVTGHHTNLLSSPEDPDFRKESFDNTIKYLLDSAGVSNDKIVPGAAFYGKGWMDADSSNSGLYLFGNADTTRTRIRFKNYLDFTDVIKEGYRNYWDDKAMAAWLYNYNKKMFWTYDDIRSIALKAHYVDAYDLKGLMFWEITGDDTMGTLVNTIYNRNMPDFVSSVNKANTVVNTAPAVEIIEPDNSDKIVEGTNVIIRTKIHDKYGRVVKVEFFVDDNSIGYNRIAPFSWVWFNASAGIHKIKAISTDDNGTETVSPLVEMEVISN
jgi:chitinase